MTHRPPSIFRGSSGFLTRAALDRLHPASVGPLTPACTMPPPPSHQHATHADPARTSGSVPVGSLDHIGGKRLNLILIVMGLKVLMPMELKYPLRHI